MHRDKTYAQEEEEEEGEEEEVGSCRRRGTPALRVARADPIPAGPPSHGWCLAGAEQGG